MKANPSVPRVPPAHVLPASQPRPRPSQPSTQPVPLRGLTASPSPKHRAGGGPRSAGDRAPGQRAECPQGQARQQGGDGDAAPGNTDGLCPPGEGGTSRQNHGMPITAHAAGAAGTRGAASTALRCPRSLRSSWLVPAAGQGWGQGQNAWPGARLEAPRACRAARGRRSADSGCLQQLPSPPEQGVCSPASLAKALWGSSVHGEPPAQESRLQQQPPQPRPRSLRCPGAGRAMAATVGRSCAVVHRSSGGTERGRRN